MTLNVWWGFVLRKQDAVSFRRRWKVAALCSRWSLARETKVEASILGLLQVGGTVEDHHRLALVRMQNGNTLPAQALQGHAGTEGLRWRWTRGQGQKIPEGERDQARSSCE